MTNASQRAPAITVGVFLAVASMVIYNHTYSKPIHRALLISGTVIILYWLVYTLLRFARAPNTPKVFKLIADICLGVFLAFAAVIAFFIANFMLIIVTDPNAL